MYRRWYSTGGTGSGSYVRPAEDRRRLRLGLHSLDDGKRRVVLHLAEVEAEVVRGAGVPQGRSHSERGVMGDRVRSSAAIGTGAVRPSERPKRGATSAETIPSICSLVNAWSTVSANSQKYSEANHCAGSVRRSSSRNAGVMRGHSSAVIRTRCQSAAGLVPLVVEEPPLSPRRRERHEVAAGDGEHGPERVVQRVVDAGGLVDHEEVDGREAPNRLLRARQRDHAGAVDELDAERARLLDGDGVRLGELEGAVNPHHLPEELLRLPEAGGEEEHRASRASRAPGGAPSPPSSCSCRPAGSRAGASVSRAS